MFTVVICSKSFVSSVKSNFSYILDIIGDNPNCALCLWDTEANSYEDALPDLENIIAGKSKWRAVVVQEAETFSKDYINKRNPFDVVGSVKVLQDFGENRVFKEIDELAVAANPDEETVTAALNEIDALAAESAERIREYRGLKSRNYRSALNNPLTKLGLWLYGIPANLRPEESELWPEGLIEASERLDREYFEMLFNNSLLVTEIEQYRATMSKYLILSEKFESGARVERKPESVLVLSERNALRADDIFKSSAIPHEELEYSNFCDDNIYCDRMRFVFFDVRYENDIRSTTDYLSFVSLVPCFAENETPDGVLNPGKVYRSDAVMNRRAVNILFARYYEKLKKTRMLLLSSYRKQEEFREKKGLSKDEAIELFESDIAIPVIIRDGPDRKEFEAESKKIGLAKDCPQDEYAYWYDQVSEITKKFIRYLKEPRRALKTAVKTDFRDKSVIEDERIWQLNEFQRADIHDRLLEEEQRMIETTTANIFDTASYTNRLDAADKEVRKNIGRRMSRKKTIAVSAIAIAAYFFGFVTLLIDNFEYKDTLRNAFLIVLACILVFSVCGFCYICLMRKRLKDRIYHFNAEMSGMLNSIDNTMRAFSVYLSHACNVMREFSVFNCFRQTEDRKLNILKKHIHDLDVKVDQAKEMVAQYSDDDYVFDEYVAPYHFDFTVMENYIYDMPYTEKDKSIEFLLKGNIVEISVDYIDKITLEREEIYD